MKTMLVTIVAMDNDEPVAECQADIDLETYEITDLTDQSFVQAPNDLYEGYALQLEEKVFPIAVDFLSTGNEFMLMDADAIEAVDKYAEENPDEVDGDVDEVIDDFNDDMDDSY